MSLGTSSYQVSLWQGKHAKSSVTGQSPFFLKCGRHLNTSLSIELQDKQIPALGSVFGELNGTLVRVRQLLRSAQDRQNMCADERFRAAHTFKAGDQVLLSTSNFKFQTGVKRLLPKYIGPVTIESMSSGGNAASVLLPKNNYRVHPVFHVSLLRPYKPRALHNPVPAEPAVDDGLPLCRVKVSPFASHQTNWK